MAQQKTPLFVMCSVYPLWSIADVGFDIHSLERPLPPSIIPLLALNPHDCGLADAGVLGRIESYQGSARRPI
jgi:hypothetical protein